MEIIKRKILLEESTDRNYNSSTWGTITATSFYINIQINQTIDDVGLFTDINFIPINSKIDKPIDYTILINKLQDNGYSFPFMYGQTNIDFNSQLTENDRTVLRLPNKFLSKYYFFGNNILTGTTDSKIDDVRTYNKNNPYVVGFNINEQTYLNYKNELINGVNRVTSLGNPNVYVFDAENNLDIGELNQNTGLQYKDFLETTINPALFQEGVDLPTTTFRFISEGYNQTNTSLSALIKEEFLLGIISRPEVENDVFIDRGVVPVLDYHLRLSEIRNLGQLQQYGNGYYRIDTI